MTRRVLVLVATLLSVTPLPHAEAWVRTGMDGLAVHPDGSLLAGIPSGAFKLEKSFGGIVWSRPLPSFSDWPRLEFLGDDALAIEGQTFGSVMDVVRLDGATGAVMWSATVSGADLLANAVVDASGDIVLAIDAGSGVLAVVKLAGADGAEVWRFEEDGPYHDQTLDVAVMPAGDVVVAGVLGVSASDTRYTVIRIDGASGSEVWRADLGPTGFGHFYAMRLATDAAGAAVALSKRRDTGDAYTIIATKLEAGDGSVAWTSTRSMGFEGQYTELGLVVDGAGDPISCRIGLTEKFDGGTGNSLWTRGSSCQVLGLVGGDIVIGEGENNGNAGVRRISGVNGSLQ